MKPNGSRRRVSGRGCGLGMEAQAERPNDRGQMAGSVAGHDGRGVPDRGSIHERPAPQAATHTSFASIRATAMSLAWLALSPPQSRPIGKFPRGTSWARFPAPLRAPAGGTRASSDAVDDAKTSAPATLRAGLHHDIHVLPSRCSGRQPPGPQSCCACRLAHPRRTTLLCWDRCSSAFVIRRCRTRSRKMSRWYQGGHGDGNNDDLLSSRRLCR